MPSHGRKKVRLPGDNADALSDTEMSRKRRQKHARFAELHSESEMQQYEAPRVRDPGTRRETYDALLSYDDQFCFG